MGARQDSGLTERQEHSRQRLEPTSVTLVADRSVVFVGVSYIFMKVIVSVPLSILS